jgi:hypothetical protein
VEGDFVVMETRKDFGQVRQIAFKITTYQKVDIQLPCRTEGNLDGEACAWFEGLDLIFGE